MPGGPIKPTTGFHGGGKGRDPDVSPSVYVVIGIALVVVVFGVLWLLTGQPLF